MTAVPAGEHLSGIRVKSIFCFLISPEYRKKGITKLLLERVCQDASVDGYDFVEAYPLKEYVSEAVDFMGPAGLYLNNGFIIHCEADNKLVMRKPLK